MAPRMEEWVRLVMMRDASASMRIRDRSCGRRTREQDYGNNQRQRSRAHPGIALSGTVLANVNLVMHQPFSVIPRAI